MEESKWDDAFLLLNAHPECKAEVYLPYAKWLSSKDKFDDARLAYQVGGFCDARLACQVGVFGDACLAYQGCVRVCVRGGACMT